MIKTSLIIAVAFILYCSHANAQTSPPGTLTMESAIQLAMDNSPAIKSSASNARAASAGLTVTESAYYPSIGGSAAATHTDGWFVFNPSITPKTQSYNNYTTGVALSQLIYDFGKTGSRVSASDFLNEASKKDLSATRNLVVMNVEVAYLALLQAGRIVKVSEEAVEQTTKHLMQAKAFYEVGRRPQLDMTKAEVDLSNANVNLIRARNQERIARLQLENAIGLHFTGTYTLVDVSDTIRYDDALESCKNIAIKNSPDLQSSYLKYQSLRSAASALWSQHLPTLAGNAAYNWNGFDFPLLGRWNAGITLSVPLFQGFGISAAATQAEAVADAAQSLYAQMKDNVLLDVEQNYLSLQEAQERRGATQKLVEQTRENLRLAEKQYSAGVATPVEISDAQVSLSNALITDIQALFDCHIALYRLKRAMGNR